MSIIHGGRASRLMLSLAIVGAPALGQRELSGTPEIMLALDRLNVLGSVLIIGAHPDDENTALLAYFARGRKFRTAYLSLTRGEGGQNLIGPERGDLLGIIRTQELLAARRIDGAEQFFTRAIDFGYTKSAEETFAKWGRERILGDVVWVIRRFRPDVIILRFSGTPRDGHGQHQVSAILGKEAFAAAADESRFPEQLRWVEPWQAKRLLWNVFTFRAEQQRAAEKMRKRLEIDTGQYDPVLGYSYGEIAGMSRSMHRSQGFGSAERKGSQKNYLVVVAGEPAQKDLMEGVTTTWNRVPGGMAVGELLSQAVRSFEPEHPEKTVPLLLKARRLLTSIHDPWAELKRKQLDEAISLATGLWLDATADHYNLVPGQGFKVEVEALNRSPFPLKLDNVKLEGMSGAPAIPAASALEDNHPWRRSVEWTVPPDQPYSQPYWLRKPKQGDVYVIDDQTLIGLPEAPPVLEACFRLRVDSQEIELTRPVVHRHVDRVLGQLTRPLAVVPPVAVEFGEDTALLPDKRPRKLEVTVTTNVPEASGEVHLATPAGWTAVPASKPYRITGSGEQVVESFEIAPPSGEERAEMKAAATYGGQEIALGMKVIDYPHIPPQTLFPPAVAELVRADVKTLATRIGYVMGAGDDVPEALRQFGCQVTLLGTQELERGDLSRYDAIVTGVRAYNVRRDLRLNQQRLLSYVENGGTLVVQYNVLEGRFVAGNPDVLAKIGPYPLQISRERVTVEDAPIHFPNPDQTVLRSPNRITARDFEGWVQERGLYFASEWDPRYQSLWDSHDPGEKPLPGGMLFTRYGKGVFIFSAYSWFRQLPAGVPGAFRIFANLISAGKALQ
jgi:LmbE family N-acetylglucosaminyl deacetylase